MISDVLKKKLKRCAFFSGFFFCSAFFPEKGVFFSIVFFSEVRFFLKRVFFL